MTGTNTNLHLINMNVYIKLCKFRQYGLKILSGDKILMSIKGHTSVTSLQKMTANNPDLDLVNINAYTKFGQIPSICSKDIEQK